VAAVVAVGIVVVGRAAVVDGGALDGGTLGRAVEDRTVVVDAVAAASVWTAGVTGTVDTEGDVVSIRSAGSSPLAIEAVGMSTRASPFEPPHAATRTPTASVIGIRGEVGFVDMTSCGIAPHRCHRRRLTPT